MSKKKTHLGRKIEKLVVNFLYFSENSPSQFPLFSCFNYLNRSSYLWVTPKTYLFLKIINTAWCYKVLWCFCTVIFFIKVLNNKDVWKLIKKMREQQEKYMARFDPPSTNSTYLTHEHRAHQARLRHPAPTPCSPCPPQDSPLQQSRNTTPHPDLMSAN